MPLVSVATVIPAYNEGDALRTFLEDWATLGVAQPSPRVSAIVVDDGSQAEEAARQREAVEAARAILERGGGPHRIRYVRVEQNRGKGAAIRRGWSEAEPDATWLTFIDADGAVPAREYWRLISELPATPMDILCGSRVNMAGRSVKRSLFRHLQGRGFATGVQTLFHLDLYDSQCGMKFFRAAVLRPLLPELLEDRWLLDVEVLALMKAAQATCVEVPIDCHERGGSSLVFGLDPLRMALGLFRLRARLRRRLGTP